MVIDSEKRDIAKNDLVGHALNRADVISDPFAKEVFAICAAVLTQDPRLAEF